MTSEVRKSAFPGEMNGLSTCEPEIEGSVFGFGSYLYLSVHGNVCELDPKSFKELTLGEVNNCSALVPSLGNVHSVKEILDLGSE